MEQNPNTDLGLTRRRDPDALPPSNSFETAMYWLHKVIAALGHGNAVFAIKAGLVTVILSIPYRLKNSANFAYSKLPLSAFALQLTSLFQTSTLSGACMYLIVDAASSMVLNPCPFPFSLALWVN